MKVSNSCFSFNPELTTCEKVATSLIVFVALTAIGCFVISQLFNSQTPPLSLRLSWIYLAVGISFGLGVILYLAGREPPPLPLEKPQFKPLSPPQFPTPAVPSKTEPLPAAPKKAKLPPKALVPYKKIIKLNQLPDDLTLHVFKFLTFRNLRDIATTSIHYWSLFQEPLTSKIITTPREGYESIIRAKIEKRVTKIPSSAKKPITFKEFLTRGNLDLSWCAEVGYEEGVEFFLVNNLYSEQRNMALHNAIKNQHLIIVQRIWRSNHTPYQRIQALYVAIDYGHINIFKALFESDEVQQINELQQAGSILWKDLFAKAAEIPRIMIVAYLMQKFKEIASQLNRPKPLYVDVLTPAFQKAISKNSPRLILYLLLFIEKESQKELILNSIAKNGKIEDAAIEALLLPLTKERPYEIIESLVKRGYGAILGVLLDKIDISQLDLAKMIDLFKEAPNCEVIKGFEKLYNYIPLETFLITLSQIGGKQNAWAHSVQFSDFDAWLCNLAEIPGSIAGGEKLSLDMLGKHPLPFKRYYEILVKSLTLRR